MLRRCSEYKLSCQLLQGFSESTAPFSKESWKIAAAMEIHSKMPHFSLTSFLLDFSWSERWDTIEPDVLT